MSNRYGLWFESFLDEKKADEYIEAETASMTPYMKRRGYYPIKSKTIMDNRPVWIVWVRDKNCYCAI